MPAPALLSVRPRAAHRRGAHPSSHGASLARARVRGGFIAALAVASLASRPVHAAVDGEVAAGDGLDAVAARVDLAAGVLRYRTCASSPCRADGGATLPIGLERAALPDAPDVAVEAVTIGAAGQGSERRRVLRVRVPAKGGRGAWEAIVAGRAADPVLYAGVTGLARGEDGERTGEVLQLFPGEGGATIVVVGDAREDLRICGQDATVLRPRAVDPRTMTWVGAGVQRLSREQREKATPIAATARGGPAAAPLASLLALAGASTQLGPAAAIVDGAPSTAWSEGRPGAGSGEFVVLHAPAEVAIQSFAITPAPHAPKLAANVSAPRTLFLVTAARTYAVTLPDDGALRPGAAYDVALPEPIRASCVAVVLDQAYAREGARAEVSIAELTAYSAYDVEGASLDAVAHALADGSRGDEASALLKRAGRAGLDAVLRAYAGLDAAGRARAADVAASAPSCADGAPLLVRAMNDADREVSRKGREKLERCGRSAAPALVVALRDADDAALARVAPLLAMIAPSLALDPLAAVMARGSKAAREQVRSAFARAARSAEASKVSALLRDRARAPSARLDLLRASSERLGELRAEADATVDELLAGAPSMPTRYLVLGPLAALARAGDPIATRRYAAMMASDADAAVRARAAELASGIPGVQGALLGALRDPGPRVREASLRNVGVERISAAAVAVEAILERDPWPFVRAAAANALGAMAPAPDIDRALASGFQDASPRVREATLDALAAHRAAAHVEPARRALDDDEETLEVRVAAAHALASMCDAGSLDRLAALARKAASPVANESELALGLASVRALGEMHPPDLARRLAPLVEKGAREEAKRAAEAARSDRGICR